MRIRVVNTLAAIISVFVLSLFIFPLASNIEAGTGDAPSNFKVMNLVVSPAEVAVGESVTIRVTVVNTGDVTGSYRVVLRVDGQAEETKEVRLSTAQSEDVTFLISRDVAGEYGVSIDTLSGSFKVKENVSKPPSIIIVVVIVIVVIIVIMLSLWILKRRIKPA